MSLSRGVGFSAEQRVDMLHSMADGLSQSEGVRYRRPELFCRGAYSLMGSAPDIAMASKVSGAFPIGHLRLSCGSGTAGGPFRAAKLRFSFRILFDYIKLEQRIDQALGGSSVKSVRESER